MWGRERLPCRGISPFEVLLWEQTSDKGQKDTGWLQQSERDARRKMVGKGLCMPTELHKEFAL
jgi:hypothetical protein